MADLRTMSVEELQDILTEMGEPRFRAKQLHEWFHTHNVSDYSKMTNLSKALREKLAKEHPLGRAESVAEEISQDGTCKLLVELDDGATVETVGMPVGFEDDDRGGKRLTACISSQSGCPMACSFCATGHEGFRRNLTASEVVGQVQLVSQAFERPVTNVVVMGQGEPFLNYDQTISALRRINTDPGLHIGARKITVSTVGIIEGIRRFGDEPEQFRLAVSLHATKQRTRNMLMPKCANMTLDDLQEALIEYNEKSGRRVTLEYMMIEGVNDSPSDLDSLMIFCEGIHCHVNLLPYNAVQAVDYHPSSKSRIKEWSKALSSAQIPVSIRNSRGFDIHGACGQLKSVAL